MFRIRKGENYRINKASAGIKQDGTPWALIVLREDENQPEDLEHPSQSRTPVKIWLEKLPEGCTDGAMIKLLDIEGYDIVHEKSEFNGKVFYKDVTYPVCTVELVTAE